MASFRKPKGTVIRSVPDWNSNNMANTFVIGPELSPGFFELGLYNNALDGSFLAIWDVTISSTVLLGGDGSTMTTGFNLYPWSGAPYTGSASPVNPTLGMPYGVGFYNGDITQIPAGSGFGPHWWGPINWTWPHNFPMCYVPAGWIFSMQSFLGSPAVNAAAASFYWEVTQAT